MWEAQESEKSTNTVLSGGRVLRMQPRLILWSLSETTQQNSKCGKEEGRGGEERRKRKKREERREGKEKKGKKGEKSEGREGRRKDFWEGLGSFTLTSGYDVNSQEFRGTQQM